MRSQSLLCPLVCSGNTAQFRELVQASVPMEIMPHHGHGLTPALVTHMEWTHIDTCRVSCSGKLSMHSLFTQLAILGLKYTTVFTGIEKEIVPLQRPAYQAFNACFPAANLISRD